MSIFVICLYIIVIIIIIIIIWFFEMFLWSVHYLVAPGVESLWHT